MNSSNPDRSGLENVPEKLQAFIRETLTTFLLWDVLVYLSKRGETLRAVKEIAGSLGRAPGEVEKALEHLVSLGYAKVEKTPIGKLYGRGDDTEKQTVLQQFAEYNAEQENRLTILSYLLRKSTF